MRISPAFILFAMLLTMPLGSRAAQSQADLDAEAKQRDAEDAEEKKKNPKQLNAEYAGKVTLFTDDQRAEYEGSGVVGAFQYGRRTYLIKPLNKEAEEDLKPLHLKQATLFGRPRNEGKYILVERVVQAGAENTFQGRRGGL